MSVSVQWIGDAAPVFSVLHPPAPGPVRQAVLIVSPFGWDDMGSYPLRRHWAEHLAAHGHPVLRFDLPGSGQSAGHPRDPGQLGRWVGAVDEAARWLRAASGAERLAVIGMGLGGLLALQAIGDGTPADDLVLWGTPPSGRAFARALKAFSQLQTSAGDDPALPEGWLESGGYMVSADTLAALKSFAPDPARSGRLARALLLGQDTLPVDPAIDAGLREAGVAVTVGDGPGYARLMESPEVFAVPDVTMAAVDGWLAAETEATAPDERPAPAARETVELEVDGVAVRERALWVQRADGARMFGIVTEPVHAGGDERVIVFLPAWAERCTGPNRVWAEAARAQAAHGLRAARIDLLHIGDSDGAREHMRRLDNVWDPDRITQIREVLDALGHDQVLLVGLCSGGYWGHRAAAVDPRVDGVLVLNGGNPPQLNVELQAKNIDRLLVPFRPSWWGRVFRGDVSLKGFRTLRKAIVAQVTRRLRRRGGTGRDEPTMVELLNAVEARGGFSHFGYSHLEPGLLQLEHEGVLADPGRWAGLHVTELDSHDHTLRPASDQAATHRLIDGLVAATEHVRGALSDAR